QSKLAQSGDRLWSAHDDGELAEPLKEIILCSHRIGFRNQESRAHAGKEDHQIEIACENVPDECLQFLAILDRLLFKQCACMYLRAEFFEKRRKLLGESVLQNRDSDIFQRAGHDEIVY